MGQEFSEKPLAMASEENSVAFKAVVPGNDDSVAEMLLLAECFDLGGESDAHSPLRHDLFLRKCLRWQ